MSAKAAEESVAHALRRAHERHDADLALSLYAEHAEVRIVDHANPPNSPELFKGKEQIAGYLARLYGRGMTHRVGAALQDVIVGEGRISFNVRSVYGEGTRLLSAESYEVHRGKIFYQTNVLAP